MSKCQCSRDFPEEPFAMLSGKEHPCDRRDSHLIVLNSWLGRAGRRRRLDRGGLKLGKTWLSLALQFRVPKVACAVHPRADGAGTCGVLGRRYTTRPWLGGWSPHFDRPLSEFSLNNRLVEGFMGVPFFARGVVGGSSKLPVSLRKNN